MTASPPNDKAMPDVIYAKRYGEACGGTYWNTPRQGETGTKYNRADLQAERIKRLEDALREILEKSHNADIPDEVHDEFAPEHMKWVRKARAVLEEGGK